MPYHQHACRYCKVVNKLCFWGPRPEADWKRLAIILCALPFLLGIPGLLFLLRRHQDIVALWLIGLPLFLLAAFGVVLSLKACNACVARLFGDF